MPVKLSKCVPLAVAFFAAASLQAANADSALRPLAGYWLGAGTISMKNGTSERIRCKGSYAISPAGNALNQSLLCASDSYKFNVKSNVFENTPGVLSGSWGETTRNATGQLSGRVAGSRIYWLMSPALASPPRFRSRRAGASNPSRFPPPAARMSSASPFQCARNRDAGSPRARRAGLTTFSSSCGSGSSERAA